MSSLRAPWGKVSSGTLRSAANRTSAAIKALLIGSISAEEAMGWPRCWWKKRSTPPVNCSCGMYRLQYIRSIDSSSKVTCPLRIAATLVGTLIAAPVGGGR